MLGPTPRLQTRRNPKGKWDYIEIYSCHMFPEILLSFLDLCLWPSAVGPCWEKGNVGFWQEGEGDVNSLRIYLGLLFMFCLFTLHTTQ